MRSLNHHPSTRYLHLVKVFPTTCHNVGVALQSSKAAASLIAECCMAAAKYYLLAHAVAATALRLSVFVWEREFARGSSAYGSGLLVRTGGT